MKKQHFILIISCCLLLFGNARSQTNMQVYEKSGLIDNYSIYGIRKITFDSAATMTIHETSAIKDYYAINKIRKLTFKNLATGNPEISNLQKGLLKIYPNPATDLVTIEFELRKSEQAMLQIFTVDGALVKNEIIRNNSSGTCKYMWNRTNDAGSRIAEGIYSCHIVVNNKVLSNKIIIIN